MNNNLFIVKATDIDTNENMEYEYGCLEHARDTYNVLKKQSDIENLIVLEYDFTSKKYHLVEM